MPAQILTTIPESGKYQEFSFGEKFNSVCHILFNTNDNEEWLGHFAKNMKADFPGL